VRKFGIIVAFIVLSAWLGGADAQGLQALARLEARDSAITARMSGDVDVVLKLTQAVPYRVFTLRKPARLVMDFREVRFDGLQKTKLIHTDLVRDLRYGLFRPGWSRMVLLLKHPMSIYSAIMETDKSAGDARIRVRLTRDLSPVTGGTGTTGATGNTTGDLGDRSASRDIWALPDPVKTPRPKTRPTGDRPVVVALDPGHGGIDPGAEYQGQSEANLMLTLAREVKERLVRTGRYRVFLTRNEDVFLSLQGRISRAREGGADVLISLHADALARGTASGTTVYTLSKVASNAAAAYLAASHERGDLLAGVDLNRQDDAVASVLMDLARTETMPRSKKLAAALVSGIGRAMGRLRARPRLSAGFSVLKAPDIPSVLIESGFMSNPADLSNLMNKAWRARFADGLLAALDAWSLKDAAQARLLRR